MRHRPTPQTGDVWLAERSLCLKAIVVGGSALARLGVTDQDAHPMWPDHVRATLEDFSRRLGHGV